MVSGSEVSCCLSVVVTTTLNVTSAGRTIAGSRTSQTSWPDTLTRGAPSEVPFDWTLTLSMGLVEDTMARIFQSTAQGSLS